MSKLLTLAFLLASFRVATAGPAEFPMFYRGAIARVFTLSGQRCVGTVDQWSPQAMTVRMSTPKACGAVDSLLRITPSDVHKVDHNPPGFWSTTWHVVTRPFVWTAEGVLILAFGVYVLFGGS